MSRRFVDPTLHGMRVLEVWADKNENRRFEVVWSGPRRTDGFGGYAVACWDVRDLPVIWPKNPIVREPRKYYRGRTLHDAALEATKDTQE